MATLEDGLYTLERSLADPKMVEKLGKFVKASIKGWEYAIANQDEAVTIVLKNDASGAQKEAHQKRMMAEVATLMGGKSDPVITKKPVGATTDKVYAAAMK